MTEAEEAAARAELLENVIATAQRLVKAEKDKSKITPAFIAEKVKKAADMFVGESPYEADQGKAVIALIQRFSHWMGKATTLKDIVNHRDWLNTARKKDWHYWRRYRDYLESKLSDTVVEGLDDATDEILRLLEDPQRTDDWDRRGLVVGHVQSGKTSNYSGLICKAADAGYKIIIVLAGMHNNLRSQTQTRLEESFLGYETTVDRDPGMPIGVAEFGEDLKTNSATTRAENGDFSKAIAKHFHGISPEERPWLFVVKKQKTVLTELLNWIKSRVADATAEGGRKLVTKLPLLMIDDEADNASVDTGEQLVDENGELNEEYQPKTINSLIRQILHAFSRKSLRRLHRDAIREHLHPPQGRDGQGRSRPLSQGVHRQLGSAVQLCRDPRECSAKSPTTGAKARCRSRTTSPTTTMQSRTPVGCLPSTTRCMCRPTTAWRLFLLR